MVAVCVDMASMYDTRSQPRVQKVASTCWQRNAFQLDAAPVCAMDGSGA